MLIQANYVKSRSLYLLGMIHSTLVQDLYCVISKIQFSKLENLEQEFKFTIVTFQLPKDNK